MFCESISEDVVIVLNGVTKIGNEKDATVVVALAASPDEERKVDYWYSTKVPSVTRNILECYYRVRNVRTFQMQFHG